MKAIYQTSYSFYRDQKEALSFVLLSDLHFSNKIKDVVLEKVAVWTKAQKPDYILFLGDLVHCLDELDNAPPLSLFLVITITTATKMKSVAVGAFPIQRPS